MSRNAFISMTETARLSPSAASRPPSLSHVVLSASQVCCSPPTKTQRWTLSTFRWVERRALLLLPRCLQTLSASSLTQTASFLASRATFSYATGCGVQVLGGFFVACWACVCMCVHVGVRTCCFQTARTSSCLLHSMLIVRHSWYVINPITLRTTNKWGKLGQFAQNYTFIFKASSTFCWETWDLKLIF